ncbi:hypothetical protein PRIPAC_84641, partial [Pristionchus pacificus]|uniref:Uncharacterized protein n=1 Tax=Pristionchus pacificus TaxID=54126 RepID=A0A2A6BUF7_PRIPA
GALQFSNRLTNDDVLHRIRDDDGVLVGEQPEWHERRHIVLRSPPSYTEPVKHMFTKRSHSLIPNFTVLTSLNTLVASCCAFVDAICTSSAPAVLFHSTSSIHGFGLADSSQNCNESAPAEWEVVAMSYANRITRSRSPRTRRSGALLTTICRIGLRSFPSVLAFGRDPRLNSLQERIKLQTPKFKDHSDLCQTLADLASSSSVVGQRKTLLRYSASHLVNRARRAAKNVIWKRSTIKDQRSTIRDQRTNYI